MLAKLVNGRVEEGSTSAIMSLGELKGKRRSQVKEEARTLDSWRYLLEADYDRQDGPWVSPPHPLLDLSPPPSEV